MSLKPLDEIRIPDPKPNFVGDGFPVFGMFGYNNKGRDLNPFILLDFAAPYEFEPHYKPRGVGLHPHRGFETVTIAYQGEVDHKDSFGGGGTIGTGDVQWMTAGAGVMHEEMHSKDFTEKGGIFEMVQLWVNLPAKDKMARPGYQALEAKSIPTVPLPDDAGQLRVIAGEYAGKKGPAKTFTPINLWDVGLTKGKTTKFEFPKNWVAAVLVRNGSVSINDNVTNKKQLAAFKRDGEQLVVEALQDSNLLVMAGEPIDEPIVGHGPFVMNQKHEILQAFIDFENGKFTPQAGEKPADR